MSKATDAGLEELSHEELLQRVADLDPDEFPLATHARRALSQSQDQHQEDSS